jgi:DNA-binding response OmpR family regulator
MVLLVDDDDDWRALLAGALSEEGFPVSAAADGRSACASLRNVRPAVVVTDVQMPHMDGCELIAWLRSRDRFLPVIIVTAEETANVASRVCGTVRMIQKPTTADVVVSQVRDALVSRPAPPVGGIARAARATACAVRQRGLALFSKPAPAPSARRRRRGQISVLAGLGAAVAAAIFVAALRGLIA